MTETGPQCIAIIPDGNRRWARNRNKPTLEGHKEGLERIIDTAKWMRDLKVKHLAMYAFSTENFGRSDKEVNYLMELAVKAAEKLMNEVIEEGIRVKIVGQEKHKLPELVQQKLAEVEEKSKNNTEGTFWLCLAYGGRKEIVDAASSAAKEGEITEETLTKNLGTSGMPDPDIVIRTGGEKRLSNFLTWQTSYSEWFFLDQLWPDFSKKLLESVIEEFKERKRRFGK